MAKTFSYEEIMKGIFEDGGGLRRKKDKDMGEISNVQRRLYDLNEEVAQVQLNVLIANVELGTLAKEINEDEKRQLDKVYKSLGKVLKQTEELWRRSWIDRAVAFRFRN